MVVTAENRDHQETRSRNGKHRPESKADYSLLGVTAEMRPDHLRNLICSTDLSFGTEMPQGTKILARLKGHKPTDNPGSPMQEAGFKQHELTVKSSGARIEVPVYLSFIGPAELIVKVRGADGNVKETSVKVIIPPRRMGERIAIQEKAPLQHMDISDEEFNANYARAEAERVAIIPEEEPVAAITELDRLNADDEGVEFAPIMLRISELVSQHAQQAVETVKEPEAQLPASVLTASEASPASEKKVVSGVTVKLVRHGQDTVARLVGKPLQEYQLLVESPNGRVIHKGVFGAEGVDAVSLGSADSGKNFVFHLLLGVTHPFFNGEVIFDREKDIWQVMSDPNTQHFSRALEPSDAEVEQANKPEFNDFRLSPPRLESKISDGIDGPLNEYEIDAWNYLDRKTENGLAWEVSAIGVAEDVSTLFRTRGTLAALDTDAFRTLKFKGKSGMKMNIWIYGNQHQVVTLP